MSRCFPYPPPGFEKSAALIESIKLQKEREKVKKEKKKEKIREKKEKSSGDHGKKEEKEHGHRKRRYEEVSQSNHEAGDYLKTREDEIAQLERSSLTEEQGPAAVQNLCDSSDSTQNSSKRKRHESAEVGHSAHGVGLRIRLPLLRHKDLELPSSTEQPRFSGRIENVTTQPETRATGHQELPSSAEQPSFSERIDATPSEELVKVSHGTHALAKAGRVRSCGCSCDSDVRRQYNSLILNWNLPPLQTENPEFDDQGWLFGKTGRRHHEQDETGGQVGGKDLDLGSALCSWPPRACYLPEVGIHALPYVVPF